MLLEEEEREKNITLELVELVDRINRLVSTLPTDLQQNVRQGICLAIFRSHSYKPNNKRSPVVLLPSPCVDELPVVKEVDRSVPAGAGPGAGPAEPVVEAQCGFIKARSEESLGDSSSSSSSHHCTIDGGVLGVAIIPATSRGRVLAAELEATAEAKLVGTRSSTSERRDGRIGASGHHNLTPSGDTTTAITTTAASTATTTTAAATATSTTTAATTTTTTTATATTTTATATTTTTAATATATAATVHPVKTKNYHRRVDVIRNGPGQSPDAYDCYYAEPPGHHNPTLENDQAAALAPSKRATCMTTTTTATAAGSGESIPSSNQGLSDHDAHHMIGDAPPAARATTTRRITDIIPPGEGSIRSISSSSSSLQYQESNFMASTQTEEDETTEKESLDATTTTTDSEIDGGWGRVGGDENQIDFLNGFQGLAAEARRGRSYYHDVAAAVESGAEADDEKE